MLHAGCTSKSICSMNPLGISPPQPQHSRGRQVPAWPESWPGQGDNCQSQRLAPRKKSDCADGVGRREGSGFSPLMTLS